MRASRSPGRRTAWTRRSSRRTFTASWLASGSEPFIIPVGNQAVASVITAREPAPITGEQARPIAVAAMRREQAAKLMQNRLTSIRQAAKIEYKEGFAPKTDPKKK